MAKSSVQIKQGNDPADVAEKAAKFIARSAVNAVAERGRFTFAISGGSTPKLLLAALARTTLPWEHVHLFQVDERIAPDGHPDRNATSLTELLTSHTPMPADHIHLMPVTQPDQDSAAKSYSALLDEICGGTPRLDLVHLGLGADGHTASLIPNDPLLTRTDQDVGISIEYQGRTRMTLARPMLDRARELLWIVTGEPKRPALKALLDADQSIPAGLISQQWATLITDQRELAPGL